MTIVLQIIGFHNCEGCSRKVRTALRKIGVQLLKFDPGSGNVTINSGTAELPEVIRYALERQLKKPVVILSRDIVPVNQSPNSVVSHQLLPENRSSDLQELGQLTLKLCEVLDGVEVTRSNTINVKFIRREIPLIVRPDHGGSIGVHIRDADVHEYALPRPPPSPPWAATEPSAPPKSAVEEAVYGYPPEFYELYTTRNHDHPNGCCNIM